MEDELGRAYSLAVIKRRLWYAPWCKKAIGIRFNMFFIPLKQPAPATFNKAFRKCGRLKMWGNKGRLGSDWSWRIIFDEKKRIDAFLTENGGDDRRRRDMLCQRRRLEYSSRCAQMREISVSSAGQG